MNKQLKLLTCFVVFMLVAQIAPLSFGSSQVEAGNSNSTWLTDAEDSFSFSLNLPIETWTTKADLPVARADLPGVTYNDTLYVFGGYQHAFGGGQSEVYAYNPSTDSWTQKASMNYARWGSAAALYNGVAYVFGGYDGANGNKVEAYNFASDSWTTKNDVPDDLAGQGEMAVTVGSLIYVFGGWSGTSAYSYNPSTDTYTQLANNPFSSRWGTCAYVNVNGEDRIYIMGGYNYNVGDAVNTMYYYRPAYNDWIYAGTTPYAAYGTLRDDPVIDGLIYFGFGQAGSQFVSDLFSYNPNTAAWSSALPQGVYPRDGVACGVINGKLYVVGGRNSLAPDSSGLNYNEQFVPENALTANISPPQIRMYLEQSQTLTSIVSGGFPPYSYQWVLNGTAVLGATSPTWIFTPTETGNYNVYLNVADSQNNQTQSNIITDILVYDQSQTGLLIPDWTNVTQNFFDLVPGAVNPVLTLADVTDRTANFVADPFMFHEGNSWYMFFEVETGTGVEEIGVATSSDGFSWTYQKIVLSDPSIVLSYPYVFKWEGTYYMIPNTYPLGVMLYKATDFPYSWTLVNTLISNQNFIPADASIFRYNNEWWMFTGTDSDLRLFYSYNLTDPDSWHEHPMSPIFTNDSSKARSGGRVTVFDSGTIIRFAQKGDVSYGEADRAFQVDILNETYYAEHEVPESPLISASGSGWNSWAMHTIDPWWTGNSWIVAVDGGGDYWWSIGIYVTPLQAVAISPTQVRLGLGQSKMFSSSVSGGKSPYSYQWYLNDTAVLGATSQNWIFTPTTTGHYKVYVNVTDGLNTKVQSNNVTDIIVYPQLTTSISPVSVNMNIGATQQFTSTTTGGLSPYTYQWYYTNGTALPDATTSTLTYKANSTGTYNIYLNVTDNLNNKVKSNTAAINVYSQPTATISPTHVTLYFGQSQTFSASVTGGSAPYTYQWYINGTAVPGATNANWTFTPRANGNYQIHANVTDSQGNQAKSNVASDINVYSVYLLLNTVPQTTYAKGQQVTFTVCVLNQQNPKLETTLTLTITDPTGYSFYDFQVINVSANGINEYSFNWVVPNVAGKYMVETSLVPAQLTAYDAKLLTGS